MCRKIIRKINDFGATGVPKSTKMVPRSAPKVTLEISHEKSKRVTKNCEAFWRQADAKVLHACGPAERGRRI